MHFSCWFCSNYSSVTTQRFALHYSDDVLAWGKQLLLWYVSLFNASPQTTYWLAGRDYSGCVGLIVILSGLVSAVLLHSLFPCTRITASASVEKQLVQWRREVRVKTLLQFEWASPGRCSRADIRQWTHTRHVNVFWHAITHYET